MACASTWPWTATSPWSPAARRRASNTGGGAASTLILLDVMLPGMDGFEFCRKIRDAGDRVPILFLTARDRDEDRIRGLEEGGDDYLTKPFNLRELMARVKGIFRREDWLRSKPAQETLDFAGNHVDLRSFEVRTPRGTFVLKEKEAMILRLLAERRGERSTARP